MVHGVYCWLASHSFRLFHIWKLLIQYFGILSHLLLFFNLFSVSARFAWTICFFIRLHRNNINQFQIQYQIILQCTLNPFLCAHHFSLRLVYFFSIHLYKHQISNIQIFKIFWTIIFKSRTHTHTKTILNTKPKVTRKKLFDIQNTDEWAGKKWIIM